MKKNIIFSLALLAAVTPLAHATPSWREIFKLGRSPYSTGNIENMFAYSNETVNMEKLFSESKSKAAQAQKIGQQIKTAKAMISWRLFNNNFLGARFYGHAVLTAGKTFAVLCLLMKISGVYDENVAGIGVLAGLTLGSKSSSRAFDRHIIGEELGKELLTSMKHTLHELESDFKAQLPEYLKAQGFPAKAIQATMNSINKPTFMETMKKAAYNAIKR